MGPLEILGNLETLLLSILQAVGVIFLAIGIFNVGMAFKSQDSHQRAQGLNTLLGGIMIFSAGTILRIITGTG